MTIPTLLPVYVVPPLINPAPGGLVASTTWTEESGAPRWLGDGVQFRASVTGNYSSALAADVWEAPWNASPDDLTPDDLKTGTRPDDPEPFAAVTAYGFDSCDLTAPSRAEVRSRAQQVLRMREPVLVARAFAERAALDAGTPTPVADLVEAVGELEAVLADLNVVGVIHASPALLAALVSRLLVTRTGTGLRTPGGHALVVDGGYRPVLGDGLLIATSPTSGWRTPVAVRESIDAMDNVFVAISERSSIIGCEAILGAVTITEGSV